MAIEIVTIYSLRPGDTILIEGMDDNEIMIIEVEETYTDEEYLIVPKGLGGLDYAPEDPDRIVRIGERKEEPIINPVSEKLHLKLSRSWQDVFFNPEQASE